MIDIKKCNYITGDPTSISYGIHNIVKILELEDRNCVLITKPKPSDSKKENEITHLSNHINPQHTFVNFYDFSKLIEDKSNFFRINLIIFDFWSVDYIPRYKELIDKLEIDYIIVTKEYTYKTNDDVNDYHISSKYDNNSYKSEIVIKDNINGWSSNITSLSESYIRDKKLDEILKK